MRNPTRRIFCGEHPESKAGDVLFLIHYGGAISYEAEALMKSGSGHLCQAASTGAVGCLRPTGCAVDLPALLLSESGRRQEVLDKVFCEAWWTL